MKLAKPFAPMLMLAALTCGTGQVQAQSATVSCIDDTNDGLNVGKYRVRVTDVLLCTTSDCSDGGVSILSNKNVTVEIADLAIGVGSIPLIGGEVPVGTYNGVQLRIANEIRVGGWADFSSYGGACISHDSLSYSSTYDGWVGTSAGPHSPLPSGSYNMTISIPVPSPVEDPPAVVINSDEMIFTTSVSAQNVQEGYVFPGIDFRFGVRNALGFTLVDNPVGGDPDFCVVSVGAPTMEVKLGSASSYTTLISQATAGNLICSRS